MAEKDEEKKSSLKRGRGVTFPMGSKMDSMNSNRHKSFVAFGNRLLLIYFPKKKENPLSLRH